MVGKVEGNLENGDEIPTTFRRYFVGEFVGNPSVIDNQFYRHSIGNLLQIYFVGML